MSPTLTRSIYTCMQSQGNEVVRARFKGFWFGNRWEKSAFLNFEDIMIKCNWIQKLHMCKNSLVNRGWRMNMTIKHGRLRLVSPCLGDVKSFVFW